MPASMISDELCSILRAHIGDTDLLVVYGGGYVADADPHKAALAFTAMQIAADEGVPFALSSQGIGPLTDDRLVGAAREVLPLAVAIGTREERLSLETLRACGVPPENVHFTGDDALLLVEPPTSRPSVPSKIGLSYRQADYLGLVGDTADGFPGLPGWGAKSAGLVLARYGHIEDIPAAAGQWDVAGLRGAAKLSATLQAQLADALLFRTIATVVTDIDVGAVDDWKWNGPTPDLTAIAAEIDAPGLVAYAERLAP